MTAQIVRGRHAFSTLCLQLLDAQQRAANAKSTEAAWQEEIDKLKASAAAASEAATKAKNQLQYEKEHPTISVAMKKTLVEKAVAQAEKAAADKFQTQLAAAQKEAAEARAARETAEREVQEAKEAVAEANNALAAAQKAAKFSDPDSALFRDTFQTWRDDFNRLLGCLMKVSNANPSKGKELKEAANKMLDLMRESLERQGK